MKLGTEVTDRRPEATQAEFIYNDYKHHETTKATREITLPNGP